MKGKRTGLEFEQHELIVTQGDDLLVHYLKKPNTRQDSVKFINTNGILAVTGDYGNWMFCREFHPTSDGYVSDGYWCEKLQILSTQDPYEFDEVETLNRINKELEDENGDLTDEENKYLNGCKDALGDGKFDYEYYAHRENVGRYCDHECVPYAKDVTYWLKVVFDAFDEICRRMKEKDPINYQLLTKNDL
jgi:hypothetical protein